MHTPLHARSRTPVASKHANSLFASTHVPDTETDPAIANDAAIAAAGIHVESNNNTNTGNHIEKSTMDEFARLLDQKLAPINTYITSIDQRLEQYRLDHEQSIWDVRCKVGEDIDAVAEDSHNACQLLEQRCHNLEQGILKMQSMFGDMNFGDVSENANRIAELERKYVLLNVGHSNSSNRDSGRGQDYDRYDVTAVLGNFPSDLSFKDVHAWVQEKCKASVARSRKFITKEILRASSLQNSARQLIATKQSRCSAKHAFLMGRVVCGSASVL